MNKIYVDTEKMIGSNIVFLGAKKWTEYNNNNNVLGSRIECVSLDRNYEKFFVKIPKDISYFQNVKSGTQIKIKDFEGLVYSFKNRIIVSYQASDIVMVSNGN